VAGMRAGVLVYESPLIHYRQGRWGSAQAGAKRQPIQWGWVTEKGILRSEARPAPINVGLRRVAEESCISKRCFTSRDGHTWGPTARCRKRARAVGLGGGSFRKSATLKWTVGARRSGVQLPQSAKKSGQSGVLTARRGEYEVRAACVRRRGWSSQAPAPSTPAGLPGRCRTPERREPVEGRM